MVSAPNNSVLLVHGATPQTITQFHDKLSNQLPTLKGKWNFTFKIFRNNIYSIPPELEQTHQQSPDSKYLYTWTPSYLNDSCVCLVGKSAALFSGVVQEELATPYEFAIPSNHLHGGATLGLNDPFDSLVSQRLQSLWTQRQLIKGDGGNIYELENGNLIIRTANVSLHGNFRGLLIQLESTLPSLSDPNGGIDEIMQKYDIPRGSICYKLLDSNVSDTYADLALQYSEILNF